MDKCFTKSEQEYILSKANAAQSAAGIFCAKEAFIKALGVGIGYFSLCDIEIRHEENGKPYMKLYNRAKEMTEGDYVLISISHTGDLAVAQVLIEDGGIRR